MESKSFFSYKTNLLVSEVPSVSNPGKMKLYFSLRRRFRMNLVKSRLYDIAITTLIFVLN